MIKREKERISERENEQSLILEDTTIEDTCEHTSTLTVAFSVPSTTPWLVSTIRILLDMIDDEWVDEIVAKK